ncbi:hypothetical protein FSP39_013238 [Pinctada imbricata]|uniref:Uncharacterized protein n=1 Tax=Pinctada imbricata TaxID=66713 RepID=A0AA89BTU9_PINIB|nr:hypothetical protein FSP39_013238 [Pinctada imbricata]
MCTGILVNLYDPEKSTDCMNKLRQLYFVLQASQTEPCLPRNMIATLVNMVSSMDKDKTKECLLCQQILEELLPRIGEDLGPDFYGGGGHQDPSSISNCMSLYMAQVCIFKHPFLQIHTNVIHFIKIDILSYKIVVKECYDRKTDCVQCSFANEHFCNFQGDTNISFEKIVPLAVKWISTLKEGYTAQRQSFSFLLAVQILHNKLISEENLSTVNSSVSDWLMNTSLYQLPNPYTINPFKKDQNQLVNEIDGTSSRNFFTVLNIGQYYTDDQFLNIFTFSMLYKWIYHCYHCTEETGDRTQSSRVFTVLGNKTVDYCFRLLDQCERSKCLLETINILDIICQIDPSHVPRVFQEVRRLYGRLSTESERVRLLLPILQFFVHHSKAVVHDPQESYTLYFHKLLSQWYQDPAVAFDTVTFIKDNLEVLCHHTNLLSKYFPNIFKILAWNPRGFLSDFLDIIPACMNLSTATEILHLILDLPCVTVALEITDKCRRTEMTVSVDSEPTNSTEAFQNPMYRPMFNFFTRVEGGHGDTINRLSAFHAILKDMSKNPRVIVCSQTVPILLNLWFEVVFKEGSKEMFTELIPTLLERSGLLYDIYEFKVDVKRVLAENLLLLFRKHPSVLIEQAQEIRDFVMSPRNIENRVEFFGNLIWCIGEFATVTYDTRCTADVICRFFETLEALTFELSGMVALSTDETTGFPKILSMLLTAVSKLASRCQDLIPRLIILMTKVAKQQQDGFLDTDSKDALVGRAQELINLLKIPK